MDVCVTDVCLASLEKRASDSLRRMLQTVVSHHIGADEQTQVLWKRSQCSQLMSCISSSLRSSLSLSFFFRKKNQNIALTKKKTKKLFVVETKNFFLSLPWKRKHQIKATSSFCWWKLFFISKFLYNAICLLWLCMDFTVCIISLSLDKEFCSKFLRMLTEEWVNRLVCSGLYDPMAEARSPRKRENRPLPWMC